MTRTAEHILAEVFKADGDWSYSEPLHRYRSTQSGRFLASSRMVALRNDVLIRQHKLVDDATRRLLDRETTAEQWRQEMLTGIKRAFTTQYSFGRGGSKAMRSADKRALAALVREQDAYLLQFARDVNAGRLTKAQIAARGQLYVNASVRAYEQGRASAFGLPRLAQYPGSGATQCKANCRCTLHIVETKAGWDVTWQLGAAEHCDDCTALAGNWNPLAVAKE